MEEDKENMILEYVSDQIKIQPNPEKLNAFLKNDCLFISEKESRNKILFLFEEKENKLYLNSIIIGYVKYNFLCIDPLSLSLDEVIPFSEKVFDLFRFHKKHIEIYGVPDIYYSQGNIYLKWIRIILHPMK